MLQDDFQLIVDYLPPGAQSKWVPIRLHVWKCGSVAQYGTPWTLGQLANEWSTPFSDYPWPFQMWTLKRDVGSVAWNNGPPPP
jgi:hypothetical protein